MESNVRRIQSPTPPRWATEFFAETTTKKANQPYTGTDQGLQIIGDGTMMNDNTNATQGNPMKSLLLATIAVAAAFMSACTPTTPVTQTPTGKISSAAEAIKANTMPTLEGTSWTLVLIGSRAAAWPSTITFGKAEYEGRSACNGHGGTYNQDGPRLTFSRGMTTMAACDGTSEEQNLFRALGETDHIGLDDKRLFLIDKRGFMLATFRRSKE